MVAWFIAVFLLILLRYSVFCFTNSSVCHKDDSECLIPDTQKFGEILHGKCAKTAALRRIMNVDLLDCITECRLTSGCKSVSYRQTWKTCDLNSDTDKSYLSDEQGCQFTDVLTWPKSITGNCQGHTCEKGYKCVYDGDKQTCQLSYCAEEPVVHNAVLVETFGLHKNLGYSLRYRCNPGRTMEGYPWALCQQDGTWKTLFSCYIDHCASSPCQHGGKCQNGEDLYQCSCRTKNTGLNCEFGLVSKNKPAFQSTTSGSSTIDRVASNGVDGNLQTMFHTQHEHNPKWWVDLQKPIVVDRVELKNRNTNGQRLQNATVYVGISLIADMVYCGYFPGPGWNNEDITISCPNNLTGQIVLISMINNNEPLHLMEVEVYTPERQ